MVGGVLCWLALRWALPVMVGEDKVLQAFASAL